MEVKKPTDSPSVIHLEDLRPGDCFRFYGPGEEEVYMKIFYSATEFQILPATKHTEGTCHHYIHLRTGKLCHCQKQYMVISVLGHFQETFPKTNLD